MPNARTTSHSSSPKHTALPRGDLAGQEARVAPVIYRLDIWGDGDHLYRHHGAFDFSGTPQGIESFVKDPLTRAIVGRWLPCPNWSVASHLRKEIKRQLTSN